MHLVIASRSDPLLPLSRLRAQGQMTELRADDLRFSTQEATTFLNQVMGLALSEDDVLALETRTEGWIAGLQLAGPLFQFVRGPLFALALYPFYDILFGKKKGWLYLWGVFVILVGFNSIVPGPGSIEGMVFTTLPMWFHLIGIPELVIQALLLSGILYAWINKPDTRVDFRSQNLLQIDLHPGEIDATKIKLI